MFQGLIGNFENFVTVQLIFEIYNFECRDN